MKKESAESMNIKKQSLPRNVLRKRSKVPTLWGAYWSS